MFSPATRRPSAVARTVLVVVLLGVAAALPLAEQSDEPVDLDAVFAIKAEGFERSRVMELMSWLTDVHGPRLTGSPNLQAAADYTVEQFAEWGLSNIAQDVWGEFGRGWSNERFYAHAIEPQAYPLIGYSKAWTPGTGGVVTGETVLAIIGNDADIETHRGTLAGKFVLTAPAPDVQALFEAPGRRYTDEQLAGLAA